MKVPGFTTWNSYTVGLGWGLRKWHFILKQMLVSHLQGSCFGSDERFDSWTGIWGENNTWMRKGRERQEGREEGAGPSQYEKKQRSRNLTIILVFAKKEYSVWLVLTLKVGGRSRQHQVRQVPASAIRAPDIWTSLYRSELWWCVIASCVHSEALWLQWTLKSSYLPGHESPVSLSTPATLRGF